MLQGAIIGLVVGVVVFLVRTFQQRKGGSSVMGALRAGGPEGRIALDGYVAPIQGKVSATKLLELLERYSWLAVIGDHDDLEREAAGVEGHINIVSQLQAQAAVGLLAHRTEQRDLDRLRAVADRIEREGGALSKLVNKQVRDLAKIADTLENGQLDGEAQQRVLARARQCGPGTKLVLLRFVARAVEKAGGNAAHLKQEADQVMAALS